MIQLADVALARYRLSPYVAPTPLEQSPTPGLWLKLENTNKTHSFKVRGALNAMLALDAKTRDKGIITCSSGNHAQGVAYAAHLLDAKARVLMPEHTPQRKVDGVRRFGAEAVLFGETYDEAEEEARRLEKSEDLAFISPYNDPVVVAGAGTIGLEILEQLPDVERVLVPVSGGGMVSGIAVAIKAMKPSVEVIGVCAQSAPTMYNMVYDAGYPQVWDTLAEALSGDIELKSITIDLTQRFVDQVVLVPEEAIAEAIRWLLFGCGWVAEGGGAVSVAALRCGAVDATDQPTVAVISGGNIDSHTLQSVLT